MDILATLCLAVTAISVVFIVISMKTMIRELRKLEKTVERWLAGSTDGP